MSRRAATARCAALAVAALAATLAVMAGTGAARAQGADGQAPSVPVTTAPVKRQDFQVFLRGLGQVQAFNSVLVRARVDGTLMQVPVAEGQMVKIGQLLAVIDPRPYQAALDQANARLAQDQADMANAKLDLARYSNLAKSDFASRQQLDTQQAVVNRSTAALVGDNAAIEAAKLNVSFCYILSPIDGRVGLRQVDPGNMIHSAEAVGIMSVNQVQPIDATFTLPQDDLPQVVKAMAAGPVPTLAYSNDDRTLLDNGTLLTPDNSIDPATGTIKLKASFPNPGNALWPGQFVNIRLLSSVEKNVLTVPTAAVQHGPSGLYAYVVKPDATVARQDVAIAYDNGAMAVVSRGLNQGDTVVVAGQSRLQEGTRVAATTPPPGNQQPGGQQPGGQQPGGQQPGNQPPGTQPPTTGG